MSKEKKYGVEIGNIYVFSDKYRKILGATRSIPFRPLNQKKK